MSRTTASPDRAGWLAGLLGGALFGIGGTAALLIFQKETLLPATITGVGAGALFGFLMGRFFSRWTRHFLAATGGAGHAELRRAQLLLRRPTTDAEPATHRLAVRIGRHRLDQLRHGRLRLQLVAGVLVVLYVTAALLASPWWWLCAALFSGFWLLAVLQARSLRRSLRVLEDGARPDHRSDNWSPHH